MAAYGEMRRVLRSGGRVLFSTWDQPVDYELAALLPDDPPRFFERIPHG